MRPIVLSIAGFDSSGGAGITADTKVFEWLNLTGFTVCTAITYQRDDYIEGVDYLSWDKIKRQLDVIYTKYQIRFCKIGLVENMEVLEKLVFYLNKNQTRIIWDPILSSSTGFMFHQEISHRQLTGILSNVFLITPNTGELQQLFPGRETEETLEQTAKYCNTVVTGIRDENDSPIDILRKRQALQNEHFPTLQVAKYEKHGSGCFYSSCITGLLTLNHTLSSAIVKTKASISHFLDSDPSLLGRFDQLLKYE